MPQLLIVADDLTGAADCSACFADAGYSTVIPLFGSPVPEADVVVLTTESRDMDAGAAARVTYDAVASLGDAATGAGSRWLYKKIDSALRGNPRDELLAAMDAAGSRHAIVAPALPGEGRTTIDGRQHVGGVPLEESRFASASATSNLRQVFANDRGLPLHHLDLATLRHRPEAMRALLDDAAAGIVLADAETDDDLAVLARYVSASRPVVLCGAAGFASQLAPVLPLTPSAPRPVTVGAGEGPILVVAGSKHEATRRQLAALASAGMPIVLLEQAMIDDPSTSVAPVVDALAEVLASGRSAAVTTVGLAPSTRDERLVAARLAAIVASPEVASQAGGLVLTGGDVAAAVCEALGATALWLGGEISAGQPWGLLAGGALPGLPVATKAGSFGGEDAFLSCIDHLQFVISSQVTESPSPCAQGEGLG